MHLSTTLGALYWNFDFHVMYCNNLIKGVDDSSNVIDDRLCDFFGKYFLASKKVLRVESERVNDFSP